MWIPTVTPWVDPNPLADHDGQPIGVHKATGIERSNAEQGCGEGGSSSTPEGRAGLLQRPDAFANPLAVHDPQVPWAGTDETHQHRIWSIRSATRIL